MLHEAIWFGDKRFPDRRLYSHPHRAYSIHLPTGALCYHRRESRYQLKYIHLQLAMRRHRLGPNYGIGLDNLSLIEAVEVPDKPKGPDLSSFEARIAHHDDNGEQEEYLYSRIQTFIYLPGYSYDIHCYSLRTIDRLCSHQPQFNPFRYTDNGILYGNLIIQHRSTLVDRNERAIIIIFRAQSTCTKARGHLKTSAMSVPNVISISRYGSREPQLGKKQLLLPSQDDTD